MLIMFKSKIILIVGLIIGIILIGWLFIIENDTDITGPSSSELPDPTGTPLISASPLIAPTPGFKKTILPTPTGDGRTTFIDETVPWSLLLGDADCELKGEIKFLNHNTYNNQDAVFIYKGIDHPARNIFWTVVPVDGISVGPNIFSKIPIPNGESLLGVILPDEPKYKRYEITASIQYGRQVDAKGNFVTEGGNVKVFEKQCKGKTVVVLP